MYTFYLQTSQRVCNFFCNNVDKITIPGVTDWKLSISVGASFCVQGAQNSYDEYFKQADKAMYESKQNEGNYISLYQ